MDRYARTLQHSCSWGKTEQQLSSTQYLDETKQESGKEISFCGLRVFSVDFRPMACAYLVLLAKFDTSKSI